MLFRSGEFNLDGINPAPRGMPQIEVTFDIDANGIMHISAKDKSTGKENKITIKSDSGLKEDEIKQMIREAEENAESDKKMVNLIQARNNAESSLNMLNKDYNEYKDQITEDERTKIDEAIKTLNDKMKGEDVDAINNASMELFKVFGPVQVKKQEAEEAKSKTSETSTESKTDDNVVDAEVKESK